MTNKERKDTYAEYIKELLMYNFRSTKYLELLNQAFDVSPEDIIQDVDDILAGDTTDPAAITSYRFRILMDDLRDYRDVNSIKKSRSQILSEASDYSNADKNQQLLFSGV